MCGSRLAACTCGSLPEIETPPINLYAGLPPCHVQATWKKYSDCEKLQSAYKKTFIRNNANLGDDACKYDRAC